MTLGERIIYKRRQRGWSQQDLAAVLDMKQTAVSRLEHNGISNPTAEVLKRLALGLGCSIDYLVGLNVEEDARAAVFAGTRS